MIETIEKKSKFLTYAFTISNIEQVENILKDLQQEHKKATHICYAYNFFGYARCSDDGEPSGTAGLPILNAITKNGLTNALIVVVRYFGGIKLGAGGLTRAYSNCATNIIANEEIKNFEKCIKFSFLIDFSKQGLIEKLSQLESVKDIKFEYNESIKVSFIIKKASFDEIKLKLDNLLMQNITIIDKQEIYF